MRQAKKPQLAEAIWNTFKEAPSVEIGDNVKYVIDAGSLLQRIPWTRGTNYNAICKQYLNFIPKNYKQSVIVVFDGYPDMPTTKVTAHLRRNKGTVGSKVNFHSTMVVTMKKGGISR